MALGNEGSAGASMGGTPIGGAYPRRPRFAEEDVLGGMPWQTGNFFGIEKPGWWGPPEGAIPGEPRDPHPGGPDGGGRGGTGWFPRPGLQRYYDLLEAYADRGLNNPLLFDFAEGGVSPEQAARLTRAARRMEPGGLIDVASDNPYLEDLYRLGRTYNKLDTARAGLQEARRGRRAGTTSQEDFQRALEIRNKQRKYIRRGNWNK